MMVRQNYKAHLMGEVAAPLENLASMYVEEDIRERRHPMQIINGGDPAHK